MIKNFLFSREISPLVVKYLFSQEKFPFHDQKFYIPERNFPFRKTWG